MPATATAASTQNALAAPARGVIDCWQTAGQQGHWFSKDARFDTEFRARFIDLHEQAAQHQLDHWMRNATGALALLILLDQFPRNAFRGTPRIYATDTTARRMAHQMLDAGMDAQIPKALRLFCYLPLSHAEDLRDQARAVAYNRELGSTYHRHALGHEDIVRRFSRFPHRNAILGRESTAAERTFLAAGGFAG